VLEIVDSPDLSFVEGLPNLDTISFTATKPVVLDLEPVIANKTLVSAIFSQVAISDLSLLRNSNLLHLGFDRMIQASDFAKIRLTTPLETLWLSRICGLEDLLTINFAPQLKSLTLERCPDLRLLTGIGRWQGSLRELVVLSNHPLDLTALSSLESLQSLQLDSTPGRVLETLPKLPMLERLSIGAIHDPRELNNLQAVPHLRELSLSGRGTVDITALAGRRNLVVHVNADIVRGEDHLGVGSRVVRSGR